MWWAHGIGGAKDLPISPELAIAGAVAALTVSFTVLALAWRSPRYAGSPSRPVPAALAAVVDSTALSVLARVFGLAVFGWAMFAAVFGKDLLINPFFGMFYVWLWVLIVPASVLLGPFYRAVSPVRTISAALARVSGRDPRDGLFELPAGLGYWPAALGLYAFVWMELVYPFSTELGPVRLWFTVYVVVMVLGGQFFGSGFIERADPFEVYSTLVGHLSVWGRDEDGALVWRTPLANLATITPAPGLVAVVSVLFGSTAFDSFKDSAHWVRFTQDLEVSTVLLNNLALVTFPVVVAALLWISTRPHAAAYAHSVVPIVVGYIAAHYLSYLVEVGQQTLIYASDPLSEGADYLGTGNLAVNYWLAYHPSLLATSKVLAVVAGHVLGVVAAHDRSLELLPRDRRLTGQLPLLVVMVAFTAGGLYLLFSA